MKKAKQKAIGFCSSNAEGESIRHIASFSGGKDSTAMVLRLIEEGRPLDEIVFFDTGWEFPQMHDHIAKFEAFTGRTVTVLHPPQSFVELLLKKPIVRRKAGAIDNGRVFRLGHGWPSPNRRWCTYFKQRTVRWYIRDQYKNDVISYLGIAADEAHRTENNKGKYRYEQQYPLVKWDMDEAACLAYCRARGFDWGGLYDISPRVSCFCCPLQRIGQLRNLRRNFPALWAQMLAWDAEIGPHNRGFKNYDTVADLERRFANEDRQGTLPGMANK
jgi:3'-phosphoadenosine 5'-phosphosulfate sulfotransferase (PAPS reductase)/FAD synthetase